MVNLVHFCLVIMMEILMLLPANLSPFVVLLHCIGMRLLVLVFFIFAIHFRFQIISGIIHMEQGNIFHTQKHLVYCAAIVWDRTYINAIRVDVMAFFSFWAFISSTICYNSLIYTVLNLIWCFYFYLLFVCGEDFFFHLGFVWSALSFSHSIQYVTLTLQMGQRT